MAPQRAAAERLQHAWLLPCAALIVVSAEATTTTTTTITTTTSTSTDWSDMTCSGDSPLASTWSYIGCWTDDSSSATARILAAQISLGQDEMTIECCQSWCEGAGYPFAGVEFSRECYCGYLSPASTLRSRPAGGCDMPCKASPTEICGGSSVFSAYVNAVPPANTNPTFRLPTCEVSSPSPWWFYVGCYEDDLAMNVFRGSGHGVAGVSVECCLDWCESMGYPFAGVQGSQCLCGQSAPQAASSSNCNAACSSDFSEHCGGASAVSLYVYAPSTANTTTMTTTTAPEVTTIAMATMTTKTSHARRVSGGVAAAALVATVVALRAHAPF